MTDFVQFVGEIKNEMVYKYYQMADLYVNASESESQGLTYLEALGKPLTAFQSSLRRTIT